MLDLYSIYVVRSNRQKKENKVTKIKNTPEIKKWLMENNYTPPTKRNNAYTLKAIKFFQDQSDYAEMVEDTYIDPLFNNHGDNAYVSSGSMEDIPYDDVEDMYLD